MVTAEGTGSELAENVLEVDSYGDELGGSGD